MTPAQMIEHAAILDVCIHPSRATDCAIEAMLHPGARIHRYRRQYQDGTWKTVPAYTGSADAALSLPTPGWGVEINRYFLSSSVSPEPVWSVLFTWGLGSEGDSAASEDRPSLALAYSSAWLRAMATILQREGNHHENG